MPKVEAAKVEAVKVESAAPAEAPEVAEPVAITEQKTARPPRSRSDRGPQGGGGNRIVGMGDHMPSFIALSFDERRVGEAAPASAQG
jgi:ATP-dependent RNA helicase RhlE